MSRLPNGYSYHALVVARVAKMTARVLLLVLILATLPIIPTGLHASEKPRTKVTQETVAQKANFLENLVHKSVAAKTIEGSNDARALGNLDRAKELVAEAKEDLANNHFVEANEKLDDALRLVNQETRRLSMAGVAQKREKEAYNKRLQAVRTFLHAYGRVAKEKNRSDMLVTQITAIEGIVAEAERLADENKFAAAKVELDRAYLATRRDLRHMRQGDTLTRSLVFDSPKDEYLYEIDRNDSHFMLLKLATAQKKLHESFVARVDALKGEAREWRNEAEILARGENYDKAIEKLASSTNSLLKAIRMSGIYVPG